MIQSSSDTRYFSNEVPPRALRKRKTWSGPSNFSLNTSNENYGPHRTSRSRRMNSMKRSLYGTTMEKELALLFNHRMHATFPTITPLKADGIYRRELNSGQSKSFRSSSFSADLKTLQDIGAALKTNKPSSSFDEGTESKTKVSFDVVEIREYPIITGDCPSSAGPPLTIDWKHVSVKQVDFYKYEEIRTPHRRSYGGLQMPSSQRKRVLKNLGYSRADIDKSTKLAAIARDQRKSTRSTLKYQKVHEKMESLKRHSYNMLTMGSKSRKEREFLEQYHSSSVERASA